MTDNHAWTRFREWWQYRWHVDTYRCRACGFELKFTRHALRGMPIENMLHSHAVQVMAGEIISYPMTNIEPRLELVK